MVENKSKDFICFYSLKALIAISVTTSALLKLHQTVTFFENIAELYKF